MVTAESPSRLPIRHPREVDIHTTNQLGNVIPFPSSQRREPSNFYDTSPILTPIVENGSSTIEEFIEKYQAEHAIKPGISVTPRQQEIAFLVAQDKSNEEIGRLLGISHKTVITFVNQLFFKYSINSRTEIINAGLREGFLDFSVIPSPYNYALSDTLQPGLKNIYELFNATVPSPSDSDLARLERKSVRTINAQMVELQKSLGLNSRVGIRTYELQRQKFLESEEEIEQLLFVENLPVQEIAQRMGILVENIGYSLMRGRHSRREDR